MTHSTPETAERARKIGTAFVREAPKFATCPHCHAILMKTYRHRCEECGKWVSPPAAERVVFDQWPLKRLHVRGIVADIQFEAGLRYYAHWYHSGMMPLGGIDLAGGGSGRGEGRSAMAGSERQAWHREMYRNGERALGPVLSPYVDGVVLREEEPEAVGRRQTGRVHAQQARAVAIEMLRGGLGLLAKEFKLG